MPDYIPPMAGEEFVRRCAQSKRKKMRAAMESLKIEPVHKLDARVSFFIKADKIRTDEHKVPRGIQFRGARYTFSLGRHLRPFEEVLYGMKGLGPTETRMVAKGLCQTERGALLRRKWDAFADPVAILLDATKWDAHVVPELLKMEHSCYKAKNHSAELARLLKWQLVNRGRSRDGLRYRVAGTRMSGDYNTALGNCMLNLVILTAWVRRTLRTNSQRLPVEFLVDGDDSVLICEAWQGKLLAGNTKWINANCGMSMKSDVAKEFELIDFCQSRPIQLPEGWRMVRYPDRAISKGVISVRDRPDLWGRLAFAVGSCELALNSGVPILQDFALALQRVGDPKGLRQLTDVEFRAKKQARLTGWGAQPITPAARVSFECAFGIAVEVQLLLEKALRDDPMVLQRGMANGDVYDRL